MGILDGVAYLLKNNTGVLMLDQRKQISNVEQKDKSNLILFLVRIIIWEAVAYRSYWFLEFEDKDVRRTITGIIGL